MDEKRFQEIDDLLRNWTGHDMPEGVSVADVRGLVAEVRSLRARLITHVDRHGGQAQIGDTLYLNAGQLGPITFR